MSTETLHQQVGSRQSVRFSRIPPGSLAALDRAVRKACRLVMDQLLLDLQPYLQGLLSRSWLAQGDVVAKVCTVLERHCELYGRVRSPCREVGVLVFFFTNIKLNGDFQWKNPSDDIVSEFQPIMRAKLCS